MKNYKYTARDSSGVLMEGVKPAADANDVAGWLREQSFIPVSVNEMTVAAKKKRQTASKKRIKSADLAALCWQLCTMIEGGISITVALETIAEDIENQQLQKILKSMLESVERGETFSSAIAAFPKVFNRLCCALVLAGETGGNLPEALRKLAEYFDNRDKLKKKVQGAMAYPVVVLVFIVLIVIFIMAFIIPRFRTIFDQIGGELPAFTRGFMAFYDFLHHNLIYIIGGSMAIAVFTVLSYTKSKKGHYWFSKMALKLPLLGKILSQAFIAIFCRTMATLLTSGVSVLEVFEITSGMTGNDVIKDAIVQARNQIVGGSNISAGMAVTGFFPNMVIKMTQAGEESGLLSKMLNRAADYYERKVDSTITTVMGMLEPILIVTVGGIVLVVVLALYLPIFTMSDIAK